MTPQLNAAQLQHAIENGEKLLAAKKLEISAYQDYVNDAPAALGELLRSERDTASTEARLRSLQDATENLFKSKIARAEVELEELEMQVKAYKHIQKQTESRIQVPGARMG